MNILLKRLTSCFKSMHYWIGTALTVVLLVSCGGGGGEKTNTAVNEPLLLSKSWQIAKAMGPGVNFGGMFEAPNEGDWGVTFQPELVDAAWNAGFRTIRLPVRWSNHASGIYPYAIDTVFMSRVAYAVDTALAKGFHVILNMHLHHQLDGDALDSGEFAVNSAVLQPRFVAMWEQIAVQFKNRSDRLLFEFYNEPHGSLTADSWNQLLATTLKQVRLSNPDRIVILGGINYNDAFSLGTLTMPSGDLNLMATFHSYEPFEFTHQGANWVNPPLPTGVTCCSTAQIESISLKIRHAALWSSANGFPVLLGEFGANSLAGMTSRVAYTRQVRTLAEAANMPWIYWEFTQSNFSVYDLTTKTFKQDLLNALIK